MISRRSFLSALCALPVVERFMPKQAAIVPITLCESQSCEIATVNPWSDIEDVYDAERRMNYYRSRQMELINMVPRAPYVYKGD
ncbi:MAG: hypothetical protein RLY20_1884 [Verrucomicrobiota bacterium]|jgi:hypothetical protein